MHFHSGQATHVKHLTLKVRQLSEVKEFYQRVLGLQILSEETQKLIFTTDGIQPLLTLVQDDEFIETRDKTTGLYHFALLLPSREDLATFLHHLIDHNISIGAADHLVSEAIYLNDPEGNGIEVYSDRPKNQWTWQNDQVMMTTDPLNGNDLIKLSQSLPNWTKMPKKTVLGHIHLHVSNLQESERFYTNGLGYSIVTRYGDQALFLSTEGYHHHIGLNTWAGVGIPSLGEKELGLADYTIVYPDADRCEHFVNQLKALDVNIHSDERGMFIYDPNAIKIYLTVS
ncbi:VOC family protein [Amphibacillus sp. Q70]|uniref:VOC family protein n=1 Tax=Amphibacillus sp. Q70 TaxID=3453416 RepID=UPI003F856C25